MDQRRSRKNALVANKPAKIMTREVRAWTRTRNREKRMIDWKFTGEKADKKLSQHYG